LKGRYFWNKRSEEGFRRAIESFNLAIKQDPNYALAYAGLADCYGLMPAWALMPPSVGHPKARAAAEKAILLDKSLAEAYAALAHTQHNYDWDWSGAETNYRRAISLNPNYATARHWYANFLSEMGKQDDAIAEKLRALDLDPLSLIINADFGYLYYQCRQYDRAIAQLKKALELDANFPITYQYLGFVYQQKKMYDDAIVAFQKAVSLIPDSAEAKAELAAAYAVAGRHAEALKILEDLKEESKSGYVVAFDFAMIYLNLGDKDRAMIHLEQAYKEHSYQMSSLKVEPRFDALRSDPRFIQLFESMHFPSDEKKK
jgi:tetratricopeptide (TPR) repeat protein